MNKNCPFDNCGAYFGYHISLAWRLLIFRGYGNFNRTTNFKRWISQNHLVYIWHEIIFLWNRKLLVSNFFVLYLDFITPHLLRIQWLTKPAQCLQLLNLKSCNFINFEPNLMKNISIFWVSVHICFIQKDSLLQ